MPRVVLLDSNLLLVWIVGTIDPLLVPKFTRTSAYSTDDFDMLVTYIERFDERLILPNVATEVNNLIGKLTGEYLAMAHALLASEISMWTERYISSRDAVSQPEFARLGITDAAILLAASEDVQVATDDLKLYIGLLARGASAVNFTHIRTRNWL